MKCLYCNKEIKNGLEDNFKIDDSSPCCCQECKDKALKNLNNPFQIQFQWLNIFLFSLVIYVVALSVNDFTLKLSYFKEILNICWGLFIFLLSFFAKPILPTCIKTSNFIVRLFGIILMVEPLIKIIKNLIT